MCLIIWCFLVESFQLKNIQKHSEKNCRKTGFHFKYTGVAVSSRFRIPYRVRVHCRRYAIMKMLLPYLHSIPTTSSITVSKSVESFFSDSSFCTITVTSCGRISIKVLQANFRIKLSLMGPLGISLYVWKASL